MKANVFYFSLLPTALVAFASPITPLQNTIDAQWHLAKGSNQYPGFSLDLSELRLVQFDEAAEPIWISELEKIEAKAHGQKFLDMLSYRVFNYYIH
jgi:leucyl aminopeptidase